MGPAKADYQTAESAVRLETVVGVLAEEKGWRDLPVPPMSLVVFRREDLAAYPVGPFDCVARESKGSG